MGGAGRAVVTPHDFLAAPLLVRPVVTPELARAVVRDSFGLDGRVTELGSQQDRNFLVAGSFVLKVANPVFSDEELDAQDAALLHLAARLPDVEVPRLQSCLDGGRFARFACDGRELRARLLSYVPGFPLADCDHLAPVVVRRLGAVAGAVCAGLADLRHPGLDRRLQWDARSSRRVCELLAPYVRDTARRELLLQAVAVACDRLDALAGDLRVQPVHGDVTDDNVVCARGADGRAVPTGVIDLGDVGLGWVVGDLAATCTSVLHHDPTRPLAVLPAVAAYDEKMPLTAAELAAWWPAVVARAAVLVVSGRQQGAIDPDNAYALSAQDREWAMFEAAVSLPAEVATAAVRQLLRRPVPAARVPRRQQPLLPDSGRLRVLDLSVTSAELRDGSWCEPAAEQRLAAAALAGGEVAAVPYGQARLTRTAPDSRDEPATVGLGVEVSGPAGTRFCAPFDGVAGSTEDGSCVLSSAGFDLLFRGLPGAVAGPVVAGQLLGTVAGPVVSGEPLGSSTGPVLVQLCAAPGLRPPAFVRPSEFAAWAAVCPDPTSLLGPDLDPADSPSAGRLLALRHTSFAAVQEHYYADPPQIERGWRHHLMDTGARTYLDAVNNVTAVGHGHPRVTAAAARQWSLLNTNSRFHYRVLAEFSSRLAALLPAGLDTVFLVNSGSEAVDLALRLAKTHTGREDVFCLAEGYHGWTAASDAVSTSVADNPQALATRPGWVHPLAAPNAFRGLFRGADAGPRYVADAERVLDEGPPPAAFISEAFSGNAGGIPLPDGYLTGIYQAVRAGGGLCVADEVQSGYGRLGSWFWGFEQQQVVPDIVTVAKAMGNGHPLGAVITRRHIAESFAGNGYFFSSAGGSPVSCAVGLAVLDVLRDERLQENAAEVGSHLRARFERLAADIPMIGAVHGFGLYLGVELVRDRGTLEPATHETAAICERLLELGVVLQPTGDRLNVLKIKPPLCLTRSSADYFVDTVAEVLLHGW